MEGQYSDKVMDHFLNPRNVGEIPDASGIGSVGNPICGDVMKMFIKVENGVIIEARFKTYGCGAAIASSSMVTEMVKGKTIDEAIEMALEAAESIISDDIFFAHDAADKAKIQLDELYEIGIKF